MANPGNLPRRPQLGKMRGVDQVQTSRVIHLFLPDPCEKANFRHARQC